LKEGINKMLSTSPTLGGYVQGMQAQMMSLIGALIFIAIVWWLVRLVVYKTAENEADAVTVSGYVSKIAWTVILLTFAGFSFNALTFATNQIPHSDLDKSSVYEDMNANIKKQ
jgi:branched-subunit amino acid permease